MLLRLHQLTKQFGRTTVLRGVTLEVAERELFFLLGPSGCGKTTLLRVIAGFYQPDAGTLRFGDRLMNGVEPHRRNTGMVFQNYALWPHLTVQENVVYGLDVRAIGAAEKRERVAEALRIVRMEAYADRTPNQLSGGQQQRVALARALVIRPDVLLLDEPLSNLDARLRLEMRDEILRIHQETRSTTVYVTHDQKEALSMADRLAILRDGVIEQIGTPREVYRRPANRFVAEFIGEANWLSGTVATATPAPSESGLVAIDTAVGRWMARADGPRLVPGTRVDVGFRPEAVRVSDSPDEVNRLAAEIESVTYLGEIEQYRLRLADGTRIKAFEQDPVAVRSAGTRLECRLSPGSLFVLPAGQERGPIA